MRSVRCVQRVIALACVLCALLCSAVAMGGESLLSGVPKYLREDLLLYYSFDKPFTTEVTDLSGNGNHGEAHGVEHRPEGKYGAAGSFDGIDDSVCVENVHLDKFTFAAWIKTSTGGINNRRVFLFDSGDESFFAVQGATGRDMEFNTVIRQEGEDEWEDDGIETEDKKLQENTWTHIAVSFDGTRVGIYFDGRLIQMKELARDGFTGTLYIGGIEAHRGEFWQGTIDEVAIFKRALFAAEITYLYDPTEDNPLVELKAHCESGEERPAKLLDILQRVAKAMQVKDPIDPNLQSGRGVAHFYEIQKESTEKDRWEQDEEESIIQFQFKGDSSRSDIFSGFKGTVKQLEWIFAENPEYGIRYDGDDLSIEDNHIGIFHRDLGYDMHPDTFNRFDGIDPAEFLYRLTKWADEEGLRLSVTINDDGILQLAFVRTAAGERGTLQARMNINPPARVLSLVETEENLDERRTKTRRQYRVSWQWHGDRCYVKDVERTAEETEFDNDHNPEQPRHRYMRQRLEVLAYASRAAIPDRAFTVSGLPLAPDTDIWDRINKSEYSVDDVLRGRIRPGPRYKPLIGAKLPSLNALADDAFDTVIQGKAALICFFDMQQRPSRNCLRQLSTRAQELKAKDIVIIAVQASKVEIDALDKWVSENNIVFPLGMIQGNLEQTRLAWGIKSLPWLILTDSRHIVQAEGFGIIELDDKIEAANM